MKNKSELFMLLLFIGSLVVISIYFFFSGMQEKATESKSIVKKNKEYVASYQDVKVGLLEPEFLVYGTVLPKKTFQAYSKFALTNEEIKKVLVEVGDVVPQGALLLEIDSQNIQRKLEKKYLFIEKLTSNIEKTLLQKRNLEEILDLSTKKYNLDNIAWSRALKLHESNLITSSDLEAKNQQFLSAKSSLQNAGYQLSSVRKNIDILQKEKQIAQLELEEISSNIKGTEIYAPFNGRVLNVSAKRGQRSGGLLVELYDINALELRVDLSFNIREKMKKSSSHSVVAQLDGKMLALDRITSQADQKTYNNHAFFSFDDIDNKYVLNDILPVIIRLPAEENAFLLENGIFYESSNSVFSIDEDSILRQKKCDVLGYRFPLGLSVSDNAKILLRCQNINDEARVLATLLPNVYDGVKVKLINPLN